MSDRENEIMKPAQVAMVSAGAWLWRNNVGTFLQGKAQYGTEEGVPVKLFRGDVLLRKPRHISCGLAYGSSDLIGFTPIIVTQEMVGHTVAVFTSPEAKNEVGNTTKEQRSWLENVNGHGGIGFAFRSVEEAREQLVQGIARIKNHLV